MKKFSARRLALDGILTALALVVHIVEQLVPLPFPIPGIRLGLSNVVTLFAVFALSPVDGGVILFIRIFLGSLFSGQVTALLYSLTGGILCYGVTVLLHLFLNEKQMWFCGMVGAILHVVGQLFVAYLLTGTKEIFFYLPVLVLAATLTGIFTGLLAQFILRTIKNRTHLLG